MAQKSLYNVWPTVARNIYIGALQFVDGHICNNTWKIRFCCQNFHNLHIFIQNLNNPFFHVFFSLLPRISVFKGLFYVFTNFLVRLHHWIDYYYTVPKPENAKLWLRFVGCVSLNHRISAKFVRIRRFYCSVRNPFILKLFYWSTTTFRRSPMYTLIPSTCTNVNLLFKTFDCLKIYGFRKSAVKSANSGTFGW